jgi:hypothetical protein
MKDLVRYWRSRIQYRGQLDRSAFTAWCDGAAGRAVLAPIAAQIRFAPLGRIRAARRRLWKDVTAAAGSQVLASSCQQAIDAYLARLEILALAQDLPRISVALHRLIAVPRLLANAAIDRQLDARLDTEATFATVNGRTALRDWFILSVISGVERAIQQARPSPKDPLAAGDEWLVVGVNDGFEWRAPFTEATWNGHYYAFERTRQPMTRAVLKGASDAIARMESSLRSLSRIQRDDILRRAGASLEEMLARYAPRRRAVGS